MTIIHQTHRTDRGHKMLLLLLLLFFPFLTLLFWAGGGGKEKAVGYPGQVNSGLNMELPGARLSSDKGTDKLGFYQQAARDSIRKEQERRTDPFWSKVPGVDKDSLLSIRDNEEQKSISMDYNSAPSFGSNGNSIGDNEAKVYQKLEKLNSALEQSREMPAEKRQAAYNSNPGDNASANDARKLEAMMRNMSQNNTKDPEIDQLNSMLDKIAVIQHPDAESHPTASDDSVVNKNTLTVRSRKKGAVVSLMTGGVGKEKTSSNIAAKQNGFYWEGALPPSSDDTGKLNTFSAVIPRAQEVVSGATVQLQLKQDVDINGILIGKGTALFGVGSLNNERLQIRISSIRYGSSVYPVTLEVYDLDGIAGIYVPGSITRETAKASVDRSISNMGVGALNPSLGAQAASAGIETVKSLIGRKTKLVRVALPAGYQVLLKDSHVN